MRWLRYLCIFLQVLILFILMTFITLDWLEYLVLQMRILRSIVISDQDMQFIFCKNGDNTVRLELEKDSKTQLTFTCSK